jgi:E3 ubiquitin-protein ligase BOI and related proteins
LALVCEKISLRSCFRVAISGGLTDAVGCCVRADCGGGRKRQREAVFLSPQFFSLQPQEQGPKFAGVEPPRKRPATSLRLDIDEGSEHVSSTSAASASCLLSDELAAQRDQHRIEMDRLIQEHVSSAARCD